MTRQRRKELCLGFTVQAQQLETHIASILKGNVQGIAALMVLNPVSNFLGKP